MNSVKKLASFLAEYTNASQSTRSKIVLNDGRMITRRASTISVIQEVVKENNKTVDNDLFMSLVTEDGKLPNLLAQIKTEAMLLKATKNMNNHLGGTIDLMEVQIAVDMHENNPSKNKYIVYDDALVGIKYGSWRELVSPEIVNNIDKVPAQIEYNPTRLDKSWPSSVSNIKGDELNLTTYNTYLPPDWKLRRERGDKGTLHPILEEFFDHFIPDIRCREYLFERMMMIVDKRLPIILVMNTLTGTGKGLFVESIMQHGVGRNNFVAAPPSWDKSGFNAWMKNTQVVWFDEEEVRPDGKDSNTNYLKRLVNEYQAIEEKGKDVSNPKKVWGSLFITNNQGTKNFRLEEDNRRFSVLDVAEEKMSIVFGEDGAEEIGNAIAQNKDNMIDEFWLWLSERYSTQKYGGEYALWKGKTYEMFLYESRTQWQKSIIDVCTGGEVAEITVDELRDIVSDVTNGKGFFPQRNKKIESFLKEYTTVEGHRLGVMHQRRVNNTREHFIKVNPVFVKESVLIAKERGLTEIEREYVDDDDNTSERISEVELNFDLDDL